MAPGTCARVVSICLEEAGQDFETVVVRFMRGEHKAPGFRKLNPKGKVPAIVMDGETLTENVAIITYLHERFPEARLMPPAADALTRARQVADLCFCSATLHPIVTRIRMPQFFAREDAVASVWEKGSAVMVEFFELIKGRLAAQRPSVQRAWQREHAATAQLEAEGLNFKPPPRPRDSN
jgi:glutathione S-transferase